jgi:hypothetical protein
MVLVGGAHKSLEAGVLGVRRGMVDPRCMVRRSSTTPCPRRNGCLRTCRAHWMGTLPCPHGKCNTLHRRSECCKRRPPPSTQSQRACQCARRAMGILLGGEVVERVPESLEGVADSSGPRRAAHEDVQMGMGAPRGIQSRSRSLHPASGTDFRRSCCTCACLAGTASVHHDTHSRQSLVDRCSNRTCGHPSTREC